MKKNKFLFGDIVVVENSLIGVIVKCWENSLQGNPPYYEVYVRSCSAIKEYAENEVERYRVRHKYLDEQELEWQNN